MVEILEVKSLLKSKNDSKYPRPLGSFPKGRTSDFSKLRRTSGAIRANRETLCYNEFKEN